MEPRRYDPDTTDTREEATRLRKIGWWGPFPSTPCRRCGGEYFLPVGDWNLGYYCIDCKSTWQEQND